MDCSTPGFPVHHQLPEPTQIHIHRISDATQPSHPLSFPSPGNLPDPGIEPGSPALQVDSLPAERPGKHVALEQDFLIINNMAFICLLKILLLPPCQPAARAAGTDVLLIKSCRCDDNTCGWSSCLRHSSSHLLSSKGITAPRDARV